MKKNSTQNTQNTQPTENAENAASKMMACMKAVDHNEKIIFRYQKKIDSLKKLNDKLMSDFMNIISEKYSINNAK